MKLQVGRINDQQKLNIKLSKVDRSWWFKTLFAESSSLRATTFTPSDRLISCYYINIDNSCLSRLENDLWNVQVHGGQITPVLLPAKHHLVAQLALISSCGLEDDHNHNKHKMSPLCLSLTKYSSRWGWKVPPSSCFGRLALCISACSAESRELSI